MNNIPEWTSIVREKGGNIPIILIGSKIDLEATQRQVQVELGKQIAEKNNHVLFSEVSAKENINVDETFQFLSELTLDNIEDK